MINVIATLRVRDGQGERLEQAMSAVRAQTLQEPGRLRYDLQRQRRSTIDYVMLEAWESTAALREHGESEAFARLGAELAEIMADAPTVTVLEPLGEQVPLAAGG